MIIVSIIDIVVIIGIHIIDSITLISSMSMTNRYMNTTNDYYNYVYEYYDCGYCYECYYDCLLLLGGQPGRGQQGPQCRWPDAALCEHGGIC